MDVDSFEPKASDQTLIYRENILVNSSYLTHNEQGNPKTFLASDTNPNEIYEEKNKRKSDLGLS